ncbi:hypothetical protein ES703_45949 [subsurface metagenome]
MDIIVLFFTILFAVLVVIVAWLVINMRKRQREAEEEQRCKAEQEAKQKAEEKERQRFEETQLKDEEECKRLEAEAQQKTEGVRGGERRPPLKRGGRPRGPIKRHEIEKTSGTKPPSLKPEIVCWNEGWNWVIGIEVPGELETPR